MNVGNTSETGTSMAPDDRQLLADLIDAYIAGGKAHPAIPAGRRSDVVVLLTGLMADPVRREAYRTELDEELTRQDLRLRLLDTAFANPVPPDEQIAREGFGGLTDDQLAHIATSPEVIEWLVEYLNDEETDEGPWLTEAISAVERARPDDAERGVIAARVYKRMRDAGLLDLPQSAALPFDQPKPKRKSYSPRWLIPSLGLAASLFLAFLLGTQMSGGDSDLDTTGARLSPGGALGGQAWTIQVPSNRRAFVTFAVLGSKNVPEYYPESRKLLEALPDKPVSYTFEGQVGDSLFVILTETPATDVLDHATALTVNQKRQSWSDPELFGKFLDETLRSLGYKHFSVRRIPLAQ